MSPNRMTRCFAALALAAAAPALAASIPLASAAPGGTAARVMDLSPERLAAFRKTMREFGGLLTLEEARAAGLDLTFQATYTSPILQEAAEGLGWKPSPGVPVGVMGRDLVAEEQFLIAGREEDFEDAGERWLVRAVKGSDAADASRGPRRWGPKFGWDDGPIVGARKGPLSAVLGENLWEVRYVRHMKRPGWIARVSVGVEDDDERVEFKIGRGLVRAATGK